MSTDLAVKEPEVLEPGQRTLAELGETVKREHEASVRAASEVVLHAVNVGSALIAAREQCGHGGWEDFMRQYAAFPHETGIVYMRLARYKDVLMSAPEPPRSVEMARRMLVGLPPRTPPGPALPVGTVEEIHRLHEGGLSANAIADLLGVAANTVRNHVDPASRERARKAHRRQQEKSRDLLAAAKWRDDKERKAATKRAVRKAGTAEQDLYAMAERMQDVMGQAHREATDREKRKHYALAGEHYRKMRDEIVRALGVS